MYMTIYTLSATLSMNSYCTPASFSSCWFTANSSSFLSLAARLIALDWTIKSTCAPFQLYQQSRQQLWLEHLHLT